MEQAMQCSIDVSLAACPYFRYRFARPGAELGLPLSIPSSIYGFLDIAVRRVGELSQLSPSLIAPRSRQPLVASSLALAAPAPQSTAEWSSAGCLRPQHRFEQQQASSVCAVLTASSCLFRLVAPSLVTL